MTRYTVLALAAALVCCSNVDAATMSVTLGVPPVIDGADIASLGGTVDIGGNQGHAWSNRPRQGQTFTTGSNALGYTLDAYSVRVRVDQGSTLSPNWEIRVGEIIAGVFTPIATENAAGVAIPNSTVGNGFPSYLTFDLTTPLNLMPNTQYGIDLYPSGGGFISLNDNGNPYAGGSAISSGSPGSAAFAPSPPNAVTVHANADRAFHVNLAANTVPEPGSLALMLLGIVGVCVWRLKK